MKRYKIGDQVWIARNECVQVQKVCCVCFGKLSVVLILGDDSRVELPCDYCGHSYYQPTGYTMEYEWIVGARQVKITGSEIRETEKGEEIRYYADNGSIDSKDIFETEEEAKVQAKKLADNQLMDQAKRSSSRAGSIKKGMSWNAGYHTRNANKCRQDAEYHDMRAKICKEHNEKEAKK